MNSILLSRFSRCGTTANLSGDLCGETDSGIYAPSRRVFRATGLHGANPRDDFSRFL